MKSRFTHLRSHVVLASIITISVSVGCSASRSAGSQAQGTDNPTINQSPSPIVSSSAEAKTTCTLNMSQAPVLHGLKLGMTPDEVLALFPGSKDDSDIRTSLSKPPSQFGTSSFVIRPAKYENKDKFPSISRISFNFLDGRVYTFSANYDGPEWPHVDKFVEKFTEGTDLPTVDQWPSNVGMETQSKTLKCADFEIRVFAGGQGGSLNHVLMQDLEADKKLKERRAKWLATQTPDNK